jgi:hypothetical protein
LQPTRSVAAAPPFVGDVGIDIVRELTTACPDVPAIPDFNEVSWTRYPARTGHITAHRDPSACGGIIAVATLLGRATFRVWDGDVLGTPPDGERMIMTFRHNIRGAGGGYDFD